MKKAQMEIMGLAVIVVLVSLGIFFVVSFKLGGDDTTNIREGFTRRQVGTKFLATYEQTNVICGTINNLNFEDLIYNCATGVEVSCESGVGVCDHLERESQKVLDAYFQEQEVDYMFEIPSAGIQIVNGECGAGKTGDKATIKIPLYRYGANYGSADVSLMICG